MEKSKMNEQERERARTSSNIVDTIEKIHRLNVEMYEYMAGKNRTLTQNCATPADHRVNDEKGERRSPITHRMNLNPEPFDSIKNGRKNVEMRLNDEKRSLIEQGDLILFTETETQEELLVRVVDKIAYPSFKELYESHPKTAIGYTEDEEAKPEDMLAYYTEEKIRKYGALAIVVEVL
jgi:ASC-1-like (ASCH) protein